MENKNIAFILWFPPEFPWHNVIRIPPNEKMVMSRTNSGNSNYSQVYIYKLLMKKLSKCKKFKDMDKFVYGINFNNFNRRCYKIIPLIKDPQEWKEFFRGFYSHIVVYNCQWFFLKCDTIDKMITAIMGNDVDNIYSISNNEILLYNSETGIHRGNRIIPAITAYSTKESDKNSNMNFTLTPMEEID